MANRPHSKTQDVWDAYLAGKTTPEIAAELGLAKQSVYNLILRGRRLGKLPPVKRNYHPHNRLQRAQLRLGKGGDILRHLSEQQLDWLIDECVKLKMATLIEYVIELVRDTHAEASAQKGPRTNDR